MENKIFKYLHLYNTVTLTNSINYIWFVNATALCILEIDA